MSSPVPPAPPSGPDRKLVWASDEVRVSIAEQVLPLRDRQSRPAAAVRAAVFVYAFTWLPAFVVFAVATTAAPAYTNHASVAATAVWALQFTTLIAVWAVVGAVTSRRATAADGAYEAPPARRVLVRASGGALVTAGCAALVLALHGLSIGQLAVPVGVLVVVLHLVPALVARLLLRRRRRGAADAPDPAT
ncbi:MULTISPECIES: hypothetical protein [unclassified Solwaraspora]|uniref:hypothetical protein n=1 Tax=unclassified Solwaraspora TaxID=2627926 RepID=UPI00248CACE5|nr:MULTISPECIES: hypothetical protein [unclassified Solwaraspora]WBB96472.1 hypothetical protein O7553_24680 [Solwaraspora sp. WMMA2059]WBC19622.1 hypothetical protein O7543_22685 [Solwaraspora sp. WMMA2080]WJK32800.1 hypothetical protein O7610_18905 [Solwaraspora sp. WMMA2065]